MSDNPPVITNWTSYRYFDDRLRQVWTTTVPDNDEAAKKYFIIEYLKEMHGIDIHWIQAVRPDKTLEMILTPELDGYEEPTPEERSELDGLGSSNA